MNTPTITVAVAHVALTKEIYNMLLSALETDEVEYGRNSRIDDARRWLHYRWAMEQEVSHKAEKEMN